MQGPVSPDDGLPITAEIDPLGCVRPPHFGGIEIPFSLLSLDRASSESPMIVQVRHAASTRGHARARLAPGPVPRGSRIGLG